MDKKETRQDTIRMAKLRKSKEDQPRQAIETIKKHIIDGNLKVEKNLDRFEIRLFRSKCISEVIMPFDFSLKVN